MPIIQGSGIEPAGWRLKLSAVLFVLGDDFWDKLHALFVHDDELRFPGPVSGGRE